MVLVDRHSRTARYGAVKALMIQAIQPRSSIKGAQKATLVSNSGGNSSHGWSLKEEGRWVEVGRLESGQLRGVLLTPHMEDGI